MMKRIISFVLLVFCLGLCGCEAVEKVAELDLPPVPTSEAAVEETPTVAKRAETEHQHIIINYERTELEAYDPQQGTELILSFSYVSPYVHFPTNPAAEAAVNEYIATLNESFYTGDDYGLAYNSDCAPGYNNMLTMAEDHYNYIMNSAVNFEGEAVPFELSNRRDINVKRCDESVLSLCSYDFMNMGDGQENVAYNVYNFDMRSGELLTIDAVCHDRNELQAFVTSYIQENEGAELELDLSDGSWYFSDTGLCVVRYTDVIDATAEAEAWWEYPVPYSTLAEYLKPEFMPDEINVNASFFVVPVETSSESSREIIDMLKVDEAGLSMYLVADGCARDVRVSAVDYTDDFYETARLWYCSEMNDCALQLVSNIPEGMPELKISYRDVAGEHSLYLSQSGEDGSLVLVDGSIQAVG